MSQTSISDQLLNDPNTADLYKKATTNTFLHLAGKGKLSRDYLSRWLSHDRYYAQAYARFIGGLLSRVQLPATIPLGGLSTTLEWRILTMLQACLSGITTELEFFEKTAKDYGLNLDALAMDETYDPISPEGARPAVRDFVELFDSFGALGDGADALDLVDGLVVLWTTEKVYLDAWSYAKEQSPVAVGDATQDFSKDADGGALRKAFIVNWTSDGFKAFVQEIQECLDAYYIQSKGRGSGSVRGIFATVLSIEVAFWPTIQLE
ncbi:heme oxygenase-like protein [Xylariaceae sp. FL0016]|nr:heme oxygenase-like protein [Xylariaceae sp. FL0016]